jgi:hypothetical protein
MKNKRCNPEKIVAPVGCRTGAHGIVHNGQAPGYGFPGRQLNDAMLDNIPVRDINFS